MESPLRSGKAALESTDRGRPQGAEGNIEQLVGRIQQKTGEGREAIEKFFSEMTSRGSSAVAHAAEAAGQYAHQVSDQIRERYDSAEESGPPPPDGDGGRGLRHRPGGRADRRAGDPIPLSPA